MSYNGGQDPDCWWTYTTCTSPKAETGLDPDVTIVPEPGSYGLTVDDGPNCKYVLLLLCPQGQGAVRVRGS